ncbi:hypothetical protein PQQ51_08565 [Paraburkholderia xenovorans]|uniref:hypothetical protein n=1 Tax=Paraburkholderia xenovorans TaxID=36873 RepID=UPI0038BDC79B
MTQDTPSQQNIQQQDSPQGCQTEALAELTYGQIQERQAELRKLLEQITSAIGRLSLRREGLLERAELAELPTLTTNVIRRLRHRYPSFLTPTRTALAHRHAKLWGIFNRPGTLAALQVLRAEYRTYLESGSFVQTEDRELQVLEDQATRLREELHKLEQLELMHPMRGETASLDELTAGLSTR